MTKPSFLYTSIPSTPPVRDYKPSPFWGGDGLDHLYREGAIEINNLIMHEDLKKRLSGLIFDSNGDTVDCYDLVEVEGIEYCLLFGFYITKDRDGKVQEGAGFWLYGIDYSMPLSPLISITKVKPEDKT